MASTRGMSGRQGSERATSRGVRRRRDEEKGPERTRGLPASLTDVKRVVRKSGPGLNRCGAGEEVALASRIRRKGEDA